MQINWDVKHFKQLNTDELYELLKLRVNVFVVEQNCPYPELDEKDRHPDTLHLSGSNKENGKLKAYLRILPPGLNFKEASFGRVVVVKENRGKGISNSMVKEALKIIADAWPGNKIRIGAQVYLKQFYESHGFKTVSNEYLEDGIAHIDMLQKLV
jgi:ElaA protein